MGTIVHVKVLLKRIHMKDNTIGSCSQTEKLKPPYKTPSFTLGVKALIKKCSPAKPLTVHADTPIQTVTIIFVGVG